MKTRSELLLPLPQRLEEPGGSLTLAQPPSIDAASSNPALRLSVERLQEALTDLGLRPQSGLSAPGADSGEASRITLRIDPDTSDRAQSYRLVIGEAGVEVTGADESGLFYGVCTLIQWLRLHRHPSGSGPLTLPTLRVTDWPDFEARGVLLDVSRDKVPKMETLYELVDLLAGWKINQLQLYTEHTFAYRGHEAVWRDASPLTADEIRQLDRYCRRRFVELVPNQNSFGHFHRWLKHAPYRKLAECPEGVEHPFSDQPEPFSLCPTDPASLALLEDLYDQLLPNFSSRLVNVGLDETFDVGLGRSREACQEKGKERVYLQFLRGIHQLLAARGYRMQFWGDVVLEHPDLIPELPGDAIALAWGYEAEHPFEKEARAFADSELEFYVCPGTSSWNSLIGRTRNALLNLGRAAAAGQAAGAGGYLITDWGDHGHLQPLAVSFPGFLAGAAFAWNAASARDPLTLEAARLLDLHAFGGNGSGLGQPTIDLGNVYLELATPNRNGTALFFLLLFAYQSLDQASLRGLNRDSLELCLQRITAAEERLRGAAAESPGAALVARELGWGAALATFACRLGLARLALGVEQPLQALPRRTKRRLRKALEPLVAEHRAVWQARNRPGGLADSAARLTRVRDLLA